MKIDGKPELKARKSNDLSELGNLIKNNIQGLEEHKKTGYKLEDSSRNYQDDVLPEEKNIPEIKKTDRQVQALENKESSKYFNEIVKELNDLKKDLRNSKDSSITLLKTKRAVTLISELYKIYDSQKKYLTLVKNKLNPKSVSFEGDTSDFNKKIDSLSKEISGLKRDNDLFLRNPEVQDYFNELKVKEELEKKEKIDEYFFNKGVSQVIIHGAESSIINKETGEEEGYLKSKIDFDVWSAMKLMELGGVKFKDGAKTSWVNPKEELSYDEEGKPYYNSVEKNPVLNSDGEKHFLFEPPFQVFDKKETKLYLDPGAVILDMSGTFGTSIVDGDVIKIDHHGEKNLKKTSTTKELFDVLNGNIEFSKNIMKNTKTKDLVWLENYIDFVTKVDNLDYTVNQKNWSYYNETMFALQKYFNGGKHEIVFDIFKNHPNINLNGFNKEELDYVIAIGDKFFNDNDIKKQRPVYKNIAPLKHKGESKDPEFFEKDPFQKDRLIRISDIVQIQKNGLYYSNKSIEENELNMYMKNLNTNSSFLGKVIIDEIDSNKNLRNPFGAVSAYGNGYDSYLILNLDGKQKNDIFVSTKKDADKFANRLRDEFKKILGSKYQDKTVLIVRDTMVIVRDEAVKELDIDTVREIIIKALDIGNYTPENRMEELLKEIEESSKKTRQFLESIS